MLKFICELDKPFRQPPIQSGIHRHPKVHRTCSKQTISQRLSVALLKANRLHHITHTEAHLGTIYFIQNYLLDLGQNIHRSYLIDTSNSVQKTSIFATQYRYVLYYLGSMYYARGYNGETVSSEMNKFNKKVKFTT